VVDWNNADEAIQASDWQAFSFTYTPAPTAPPLAEDDVLTMSLLNNPVETGLYEIGG
jgi:hypothetical protein